MRKSINNQKLTFKDLLFGKKQNSKVLPEDFFETLIDLELKINKEFTAPIFQKLVNQYNLAIEYYKGKQDNQHMEEYLKRLNHLIVQSEVLQKTKQNAWAEKQGDELGETQMTKKPEKKKLVSNIQYKNSSNTKINNQEKVEKIITLLSSKSSCDMLSQNLNEQAISLKNRIQSRKQNKVLKQNKSNSDLLLGNKKLESLIDMTQNIDEDKSSYIGIQDLGNSFEGINDNFIEDPNSFIKLEENVNRLSISLSHEDSVQSPNDLTALMKIQSKQKGMFSNLMDSIDIFLDGFSLYYGSHVFNLLFSDLISVIDRKEMDILETKEKFSMQIFEMQSIIKDQSEAIHTEGIKLVIQSLEQDRDQEIHQIQEEYSHRIKSLIDDFKGLNITENRNVISLKNKLQESVTNTLSDVVCLIKGNK